MRVRSIVLAAVLTSTPIIALAQSTGSATPQAPAAPAAPAKAADDETPPFPTTRGLIDLGARVTNVSGDDARYERYRDMGDGLFLDAVRYSTERQGWVFDTGADHVGRRDQRYSGLAVRPGTFKVWAQWDQIPMLMSRTTRTLFTSPTPGILQLDDAIQQSVQAQTTSAGQAAALGTAVQNARLFELGSRRHIFSGGAEYISKLGLTLSTNVRRVNREGNIPFGGSFGHSNVVETMAPVNHQLTDVDGSAEYQQGNLLVRGGYTGSWFHNDATSITFDNPWRLTDSASASSRGRIALPPSNSLIGVNGLVSYRLPYKTRVSAFASVGSLRDAGDALLPFTVNTALPAVALDRTTTEGHARTSAVNLTLTSRPTSNVDVDVRFRMYDYDNRTPEFTTLQRVAYDNAVSAVTNTALQTNEPFGVRRDTLDADVRYSPLRLLSAGVGYSYAGEERTHRIFEQTNEHTLRVVADSVTSHWFSVRTKFEHAERRGEGDAAAIAAELGAIGEQAGMRHFDIASRNRNRVTVIGTAMPLASIAANVSIAAGKDDYLESQFGLRDNAHRVYGAGLDWSRDEDLGAGVSYALERYTALSRSRQATTTAEFNDASRNWATDSLDRARTWTAHGDWRTLGRKLLISASGDVSLAKGFYQYITGPVPNRTLPEESVVPTTLPDPKQLPPVRSELARGDLDLTYALSTRWSVGTSFWVERYRVTDFTLDSDAQTRIDLPGALLLGYQYLPYTAKTLWVRAIYRY